MPDEAKEALRKLVDGFSESEAREAFNKLTDISAPHQLVRLMLGALSSAVAGKLVSNLYTSYVKTLK